LADTDLGSNPGPRHLGLEPRRGDQAQRPVASTHRSTKEAKPSENDSDENCNRSLVRIVAGCHRYTGVNRRGKGENDPDCSREARCAGTKEVKATRIIPASGAVPGELA